MTRLGRVACLRVESECPSCDRPAHGDQGCVGRAVRRRAVGLGGWARTIQLGPVADGSRARAWRSIPPAMSTPTTSALIGSSSFADRSTARTQLGCLERGPRTRRPALPRRRLSRAASSSTGRSGSVRPAQRLDRDRHHEQPASPLGTLVGSDSRLLEPLLDEGTPLSVIGGPVLASGYTWYEVDVPVTGDGLTEGS